ncbi:MAG: IS21-like element helper ATPase IstB [Acidobacteria bacterium]|nr:IS21-like element helper ATPase IstB [Acidobacteriota bacterium]
MPSAPTVPATLSSHLRRLGLLRAAADLNDLIARATKDRWTPITLLETLAAAELEDRAHRSLERRFKRARLGRFKPIADFDWAWPKSLDRPLVERVLGLDFIPAAENLVLVGAQGLGKTMIAKNVVHQAILHGHSALFTTASDLLLDLNGQETARSLERRLRHYTRPHVLAIDEIGYLAYDAHAADLLFQIVTRRYEQKSIVLTTNLAFRDWHTIFPNASCAVGLIDRLTHHAAIVKITGDSYRLREAEHAQKVRRTAS